MSQNNDEPRKPIDLNHDELLGGTNADLNSAGLSEEDAKVDALHEEPSHEEHGPRVARSARSLSSNPAVSENQIHETQPSHPMEQSHVSSSHEQARAHSAERSAGQKPSVPRARRMKLSVTRVDPWSVTKVSFLLAIAGGIIQIVAVGFIWFLLNSIGLFDSVTQLVSKTGLDAGSFDLSSILSLGTVLSAVTIFSIFEVILVMVLATIGAFLYNLVSALVGGVHVILGDD
ncbi:MAG: DUF3566 domain-containing protein [Bifidobacterium sp.]|uniref:DUF3566 domain-containing protein n=1 Tax=Bifidobacterium fermentum TaxID=3059035 RepID=A0AB39UIJ6_9BIFI